MSTDAGITTHNTTQFRVSWMQTHLLQPVNPAPIQKYCNETEWRPNLIFNLPDANGGVGNVRAEVLDFVFYAIEAGASIILPGMAKRSEEVLFDVWGAGRAEFRDMFDEDHFRGSLSEACPQLTIYDPADEELAVVEGSDTSPRKVEDVYWPEHPLARRDTTKEAWLRETNAWLQNRNVDLSARKKYIVDVERTMWEVDTRNTPLGFRLNFPMILRINPSIRRFAAIAMSTLARRHGLELRLDPSEAVHTKAFYGAHLRTESDTVDAGWQASCSETECGLNFTAQTDAYIAHASTNKLNVIYTASGNASEIQRFKTKALANFPPLTVLDKFELLPRRDAEELKQLHWDQQALVDLEILLRCSMFGGMAKSSFAFTIAMARNTWLEKEGYVMENAWDAKHKDATVAFEDRLSKVWGRNQLGEERIPRGAWP